MPQPQKLENRRDRYDKTEMDRRRVLLSGVATVVLCTALPGCVSDVSRYCQENYSDTQLECERKFRKRYSGIGHSKASERLPQ